MKDRPEILVVDDDPNISRLEQLYLEKENFEVRTAADGNAAIAEFRRRVEIDDRDGAEKTWPERGFVVGGLDDETGDGAVGGEERHDDFWIELPRWNGHNLPSAHGGIAPYSGELHPVDEVVRRGIEIEDYRGRH